MPRSAVGHWQRAALLAGLLLTGGTLAQDGAQPDWDALFGQEDAESSAPTPSPEPSPEPTSATIPVGEAEPPPLARERRPARIEEIIVTASKRSESASSLAGAVTAIGREQLDEAGASSFEEYLSLSPGVQFSSSVPGISQISIRGVTTDTLPSQAQTAVGVYFFDLPLTDPAAPMVVPDIDAFDAERVEVLRGPQGALFGSASLGGAINYIPQLPDAGGFAIAAQGIGSQATNASLGGSGKLMINLPLLGDSLALRAVGHHSRTPGFIDNQGTGVAGANEVVTQGGRAMLGWTPTAGSRLDFIALYQQTEVADGGYVNEELGDLQKDTPFAEPNRNEFELLNLRYELDTDHGSWALIGGWQDKASALEYDGATALGLPDIERILQQQFGRVTGYSGELRFVSPPGERFEYLAGLSYADRDESFDVVLDSATLEDASGALSNLLQQLGLSLPGLISGATTVFRENVKIRAPEKAAFFDLTWRFLSEFKLTAGGRYYDNALSTVIDGRGLLLAPGGSTQFQDTRNTGASGFNPKLSLAWEPTDDLLLYGLYSRGYRLGGPNLTPNTAVTPTAPSYGPDEVNNFELGIKSAWFGRRLTADLALFHIDWRDIPLTVVDSAGIFKFLDNAGDARINGVELSVTALPLPFLSARSSITWVDGRLLDDYDPGNGRPPAMAGDRLPGSPEWALSNTVTASWDALRWQPSLSLIHRYESESGSNLSFQDIKKGGYQLLDLRANLRFGAFTLAAFGKNLTDRRGITASNNFAQPSGDILSLKFITPPRSFGLQLGYDFQS